MFRIIAEIIVMENLTVATVFTVFGNNSVKKIPPALSGGKKPNFTFRTRINFLERQRCVY